MSIRFAETITMKGTLEAALLLMEAMGDTKLGRGLEISPGLIVGGLPPYYYNNPIAAHAEAIENIKKILTNARVSDRPSLNQVQHRRRVATDWARLHGDIGNVKVQISYLIQHVHNNYRGEFRDDKPVWFCGSCREKITITECRKLGLMPKLDRSKK